MTKILLPSFPAKNKPRNIPHLPQKRFASLSGQRTSFTIDSYIDKLQFVITRNLFVEYRAAGQGSTNASLRCFAKNIFCL